MSKQKIFLFIGILLFVTGIIGMVVLPFSPIKLTDVFKPPPISKPAPLRLTSLQGTVISYRNNVMSLETPEKKLDLLVNRSREIFKVVSGTVSKGDAVTEPAQISDIEAGQQVLVIAERNSLRVHAVYIIPKQ